MTRKRAWVDVESAGSARRSNQIRDLAAGRSRLAQACVKELARSNEVTKADIKRYKALKRQ